MIAHQQLPLQEPPPYLDVPLRTGTRAGRTASELRRGRVRRSRYTVVGRIALATALATILVIGYLCLLANITRLHYETSVAERQRTELQETTQRLDDEIARLSSRERLAVLAARLHMKESAALNVVQLAEPKVARAPRIPLLSSIVGWGH
jgi:cell division protein FtsL